MDIALVAGNWEIFAKGAWMTVHLTFLAILIGFLIAAPLGYARARGTPVIDPLARAYVYVFRGTPLLVQVYLIYYGLSQFEAVRDGPFWRAPEWIGRECVSFWWPSVDPELWIFKLREACAQDVWPSLRSAWWCALIAFALNSGAYATEILRGAIAATPKGEIEAASALGLSPFQTARRILIPSALRRALPQYGNEIVFMLHGSAVASIITLQDVLGAGRTLNAKYYVAYEGLLTAAAVYMCITFAIVAIFGRLELRYLRHLVR